MTLWQKKIKPMLAFLSEPFDTKNWIYEIKFDGSRCIAYIDVKNKKVLLLNRRGNYFENRYPEMHPLWKDVNAKQIILDGELIIFSKGKPDFYKLAEREHIEDKTRIELLSKIMPATYVVFDVLHVDGKDLINLPLSERKKILNKAVKESSRVLKSVYVKEKGKKFFAEVKKKKLEGIMAKKLDSKYEIGKRSKDWLKIKSLKTLDCVICGYTTGTGKRGELFGSLITATYYKGKLKYMGKVGTGFTEEELKQMLKQLEKIKTEKSPFKEAVDLRLPPERKPIWVKPKYVCEVRFMNLSKDLVMRAPAFMRLRFDKPSDECNLEGDIIKS